MNQEREEMNGEQVDIRELGDRTWVDVVDALVQAGTYTSRIDAINETMNRFAKEKIHESRMVLRVTQRNGSTTEAQGKGSAQ